MLLRWLVVASRLCLWDQRLWVPLDTEEPERVREPLMPCVEPLFPPRSSRAKSRFEPANGSERPEKTP